MSILEPELGFVKKKIVDSSLLWKKIETRINTAHHFLILKEPMYFFGTIRIWRERKMDIENIKLTPEAIHSLIVHKERNGKAKLINGSHDSGWEVPELLRNGLIEFYEVRGCDWYVVTELGHEFIRHYGL